MDPHQQGPSIRDVLTRQDVHRLSLLWDAPLADEEPYQNDLRSLLAYCMAGQHIWRSIVPLIHFWVVESHHPERVFRQFGMKQGIPKNVDTSIELHKITLQGKQDKNWAEEHATHIALWAAHATIADAPPFQGEMSYNDEYMAWFRPCTVRHITKATSYWDTLVESQLRIMANCEPGSEIYTDCINALQAVEELSRLTLDDARAAGNTTEPAVGRGRQAGGRQGQGGHRQSSQCPTSSWRPTSAQRLTSSRRTTPVPTSGRCHTLVYDHTMEEASQTEDEMCLDIGYDIGSMAHDDAGPSHTFAHGDASRSPSTSSTATPLPTTRMSPPPTTSIASADESGRDDMRFMPTLGVVPLPTPPPEALHIEDRPRRPQRTRTHPPDCGTRHVFACVLFRKGETSQATSEEKKTGMNFDGAQALELRLPFGQIEVLQENLDLIRRQIGIEEVEILSTTDPDALAKAATLVSFGINVLSGKLRKELGKLTNLLSLKETWHSMYLSIIQFWDHFIVEFDSHCVLIRDVDAVIEVGLLGPLVNLLQNAEFDIKKEAAWAISNATSGGTHEQLK
ncbi:hypothetical protein SO802_019881 [Lithocarpus litseifolius]|uniref:Aminotransferase-like plant mobile domain-containing protein n=1 Tax=Lithocarpus litseifolius TaxID=425828 RepID=A0AAW2CS12_9ROSI